MDMLDRVVGSLPGNWIRRVSRLRWRHPAFHWILERLAQSIRHRDGVIRQGIGRGLRFNPGGSNAGYLLGTSEPHVQAALASLLGPGMAFLEAGANVGFHAMIAARLVGPSGRVICFEPVPECADLIRHNAALNGFLNLEVFPEALGGSEGVKAFSVARTTTLSRFSVSSGEAVDGREIQVPVRTLDALVAGGKIPQPDFILMDIEGAEVELLKGARGILATSRPLLLIELHGTNAAVAALLAECGYLTQPLGSPLPLEEAHWDVHALAFPSERQEEFHPLLDRLRCAVPQDGAVRP